MYARDWKDACGGIALAAVGFYATVSAFSTLGMGSISQMGPGLFPAAVGVLLTLFGIAIAVVAFLREGDELEFDTRSVLAIIASVIAFSLAIEPFGMVPAIVILVLVAGLADGQLSLLRSAILAVACAISAVLLFKIGLGIPLDIVSWPW